MQEHIEFVPMVLLLAALACFVGAYVQTAIGFGMAIVAAPILFYLDPTLVPGPLMVVLLHQLSYFTGYNSDPKTDLLNKTLIF